MKKACPERGMSFFVNLAPVYRGQYATNRAASCTPTLGIFQKEQIGLTDIILYDI